MFGICISLIYTDLLIGAEILLDLQKYGKLDVVVCNAAANPSVDGILETKESVLDKLWEINVKTSILLLQVCQFNMNFESRLIVTFTVSKHLCFVC